MMLKITQSTIKEWDRCKRKWWLSSYRRLGLPTEYRSPISVGNLVHDALAEYYEQTYGTKTSSAPRGLDPITFIKDKALQQMQETPAFAEEISRDAELAGIMVDGYLDWLEETGADADFESVEPERTVSVRLFDGVELLGKLDGKVKMKDEWTAFLEHKTVGNFTDLPSIARLDRQLLTYDLLEYLEILNAHEKPADLDKPVKPLTDGAILNMLRRVKRTARAKPPFYERVQVSHNIYELRNHWRHLVAIASQIVNAIDALDDGAGHHTIAPPTPTTDCRWSCPFFNVCPLFDDGSDVEAVLMLEYEQRDPLARYQEEAPE